ncbi:hypothetical protein [uncultured Aquimarina sp.]|uniref:hypothetical protein n=1 Tax=uncultured Aquimarina sp. TaxID=575652 RepID=UPI00262B124C|nr:hypothetical protein [uncultured Aquimarina sp.]
MGYRRGYYKKDGTYVRGHYTNSGKRYSKPNNKKDNGCASLIFLLIIILIIAIAT